MTAPTLLTTADGTDTLRSPVYGETYHSRHGALAEARHVFLESSGVAARLDALQPTRLLEVGFGTGLNFLLTAQYAAATQTPLRYDALEHTVLTLDVLAKLNHGARLQADHLRRPLLDWRCSQPPRVPPGTYPVYLSDDITLTLRVGDAVEVKLPACRYHAVYLDAFSPDVNPELWTESFLSRLFVAMEAGATLATYSAKGSVRRALQAVGFEVEKRPGPPGKRDMLIARRTG